MRDKITKRTVDAIEPSLRDTFLWDTGIPEFGCKVTPKGARIYVLQYSRGCRDHRMTIGRHGVEFTAEQARNEARRLRELNRLRRKPRLGAIPRAIHSNGRRVGSALSRGICSPHKKPSAFAQDQRNLQNHIVPLIGVFKVSEIERQDVARLMPGRGGQNSEG